MRVADEIPYRNDVWHDLETIINGHVAGEFG